MNRSHDRGRVGTLGGRGTFAGQAADALLEQQPEFGPVEYFRTMDDVWEAVYDGAVEYGFLTGETSHTGIAEIAERLLDRTRPCYVAGEVVVPYRCMLLGKPGATVEKISRIIGHGSLYQCRSYLERLLPGVPAQVHEANSLAAAAEVLEGDGSVAVVGTLRAAEEYKLDVLAPDVDQGSKGSWWLVTNRLRTQSKPSEIAVGVLAGETRSLPALFDRMNSSGFQLRSIASCNAGELFAYAHLAVFSGGPLTSDQETLLAGLSNCWLAGTFSSLTNGVPGSPSEPPHGRRETSGGLRLYRIVDTVDRNRSNTCMMSKTAPESHSSRFPLEVRDDAVVV